MQYFLLAYSKSLVLEYHFPATFGCIFVKTQFNQKAKSLLVLSPSFAKAWLLMILLIQVCGGRDASEG